MSHAPADATSELQPTTGGAFDIKGLAWAIFEWARNPYYNVIVIYVFTPYFAKEVVGGGAAGVVPVESPLEKPGDGERNFRSLADELIPIEVRAGLGVGIGNRHPLSPIAASEEAGLGLNGLADDPDLRAVVITGAGDRSFVGGADIGEMAALDPQSARAFITRLHGVMAAIRDLPVPVIAAIHGAAMGGGLNIALGADIRIVAPDARTGKKLDESRTISESLKKMAAYRLR